ncbi:MAG: hypothetical protein M3494_14480 [Actinomycetota bacterium]|nr:hypothetical protein [Rubrobacter sp.]MDQ3509195.1 hypothetical protein [Actinomycetota bacterium]
MREDLAEALKREAGLTDEEARRAVEVFEDFMKGRGEGTGGDIFSGEPSLFEDKS